MKRLLLCLAIGLSLTNCVITPDENTGAQYPSPLVLTELKVTLAHASLFLGQTTTAIATGIDQFANPIATGPVTYSSNSAAATISQDGFITTVATGNVIITAMTATKHAETLLSIAAPATLTSLQLSLANSSVRLGQTVTATISGKDQYGVNLAPTNVAWSTASPNLATVSQSGAVTGVAIGQTTLTATSQGVTATLPLSVISAAPTVQSVTLAGERRVKVGDLYVYSPTVTMSDGSIANLPVTYSVSPADAGSISANGTLTPSKTGTISLVATVNNVSYPTTVVGYDWSLFPFPPRYGTNLSADSATTPAGPIILFPPELTVECSTQVDPSQPVLVVGFSATTLFNAGASGNVRYSVDNGPVHSETWLAAIASSGRYQYAGANNNDRAAFARSLATGKTLRIVFPESAQGPIELKFRLTGMAAAIVPVLTTCGVS
ncbi:MAG: Ig-like domain-containing protein [Gemmatimonadaceae bacterium]